MKIYVLFWLCTLSTVRTLDLNFDDKLAKFALEFAAGAYSTTATACSAKNNATLLLRIALPCDYVSDEVGPTAIQWYHPDIECWGTISWTEEWIIVAFRGTKTKLQLITELIETMSSPKKKLNAGGSVQHYFYEALKSIWSKIHPFLRKLKLTYPEHNIMFTGHSLGGALASLASTVFANRHPGTLKRLYLFTFGEPRVGNFEYAQVHDRLVPRSWRIVHKYDLVAHLPYCYPGIRSRSCFPFYNHGPYHHGTEIWYPMTMSDNSTYRLCSGLPINEDDTCSDGYYLHYGIMDHLFYYDHHVSDYGENGCVDPPEPPPPLVRQRSNRLR